MQAALPPHLTDDDIHVIFERLDMYLDTTILQALIHGFYTGVLSVTLWAIFRNFEKNTSIGCQRYVMVVTIFALYLLATISLGEYWVLMHHAFIDEGQSCYTVFMELNGFSPMASQDVLVASITACISTFIADFSLIWRCWIVWGRHWLVVIIPILCTILSTVCKGIQTYHYVFNSVKDIADTRYIGTQIAEWKLAYTVLTLVTMLWCTIFLLYRIISVAGSNHGVGIHLYRGVIEALVESAALYSAVLIIEVAFVARDIESGNYVDTFAAAIKGIAPTLLVGHVAAGHARPDDSWKESSIHTVSSLNFGTPSLSTQEGDITQSVGLEIHNVDSGQERSFGTIEEEPRGANPEDIV
ncbi:uncharacterized protein ARMOST_19652 [Armillaria ostoyae]|uniref:G-protein coupled receptors family 1 profile domain-containing protein n=1 Tax=Armillaria ostoyae TaxID=47428 RepID=A0A284S571_ARMOS|nr:uncharacterized protein ARMOST_19652 [Armillaria ostoyae]